MRDDGPALLPVYATFPLRAVSGHGSWLVDEQGDEWLDAYGGHAVATCGHSHPDVVAAIADQAARLIFYSTAVPHAGREQLAETLARLAPGGLGKVFFCNSGAEANENLLGLARRKTGRTTIVTMLGGWHGRTAATLACTDGARYEAGARRAGVPLSRKVPFNDLAALDGGDGRHGGRGAARAGAGIQRRAHRDGRVPRGGARPVRPLRRQAALRRGAVRHRSARHLHGGRELRRDARRALDGQGSGRRACRSGRCVAHPSLVDDIAIGDLGSTFGGGPVPCAAALANIAVIEREGLLENVRRVSAQMRAGAESLPHVVARARPRLPAGPRTRHPGGRCAAGALGASGSSRAPSTDPKTLRLLPPLSFSGDEAALLLAGLREVLA